MLNFGKKRKTDLIIIGTLVLLTVFSTACSSSTLFGSPTPLPPTSAVLVQPSLTPPSASAAGNGSTPTIVGTFILAETVEVQPDLPTIQATSVSSFPNPTLFTWVPIIGNINRPISIANAGDGSGRLFVNEQIGRIRIIQDGIMLDTPFLDISDRIDISANEQGLLGLAFHPRYEEYGFFYVNYTDLDGNTVIARYKVSLDNPNQADYGSEKILLHINQPFPNHNGGEVMFGLDGYLYLGLGDGGSANDPQGNAQNTQTLLGKILRIDVDQGERYAVPPDNPFINGGGLPEIWATGLRNPWRFSFDRLNGDLYIADVGQNTWEEINYWPVDANPGANFGWDYREGLHSFDGNPPQDAALVDPVAEYSHSEGCSVTGGYVYRGKALSEFYGIYLFGDYCSGVIFGLLRETDGAWQMQRLFETGANLTSFGEDEQGELYAADHGGRLLRLQRVP